MSLAEHPQSGKRLQNGDSSVSLTLRMVRRIRLHPKMSKITDNQIIWEDMVDCAIDQNVVLGFKDQVLFAI